MLLSEAMDITTVPVTTDGKNFRSGFKKNPSTVSKKPPKIDAPMIATATIVHTDKFRADYYKYYTHGNYWTNPVNYDLTINSEKVGIEDSVKLIKDYMKIKGIIK